MLAYLIYRGAIRLNLSRFFTVTGRAADLRRRRDPRLRVHDLQEAAILPGLNTLAFDVSAVVPPDSWYGTLLKGIFNFSPQTTVLEADRLGRLRRGRPPAVPAAPAHDPRRDLPPPDRTPRRTMSRRSRPGCHGRPRRPRPPLAGMHQHRPARRDGATGRRGPDRRHRGRRRCEVAAAEAPAGNITFSVNNTGTKVTEFYLYGTGDRIMGEVENIGPG